MNAITKKLKSENGIVLALIVIVFAVLAIVTTSVVAIVYSDAKFSVDDENSSKAYYAARSAVSTVEQAINIELKKSNTLKLTLSTARSVYESNKTNANFNAYMTARSDYLNQTNYINNNVLPPTSGSRTHIVKIAGLATDNTSDEYTVSITPHLSRYRLEASATVKGKTRTVAKYLGSNYLPAATINVTTHTLFENSLYSLGEIQVGNNGDIYSEVFGGGDVSYFNGTKPIFTMHDGSEVIQRSSNPTLPPPSTLMAPYLPPLTSETFAAGNITSGNYGSQNWSGDYIADATSANVVLQFDNVNLAGDFSFKVKGNKALIIYTTGIFSKSSANAQLKMIFQPDTINIDDSEIYLIIDSVDTATDSFFDDRNNFKANNFTLYAPYTNLNFKNNFGGQGPSGMMEGSILGKNITLKNNADIKYIKPSLFNVNVGDQSIGTTATAIQLYDATDSGAGYWLKN